MEEEPEEEDAFLPGYRTVDTDMLDATIKLLVTHTEPNYSLPWQMRHQTSSTSSGFVIDGRRILTNAHCVDNFAVVQVKKRASSTKYIAEVIAIGRECDLALLTVHDEGFWTDILPIRLADSLPSLQDVATVVGFPIGGDNLAITQGVVSRIDMQEYVHGCCELLAIQIDAAINPGNSGGPAFNDTHECVGVAFQSLKDGQTENIGYIIPTEVVMHFLTDVERHGSYTGFCELSLEMQRCENSSLRAHAKMPPKSSGMMVTSVYPTSELTEQQVRRGDMVTHIDGISLANDGTVPFKAGGGRIYCSYLLSQRYVGDKLKLKLLRDGKTLPTLELRLEGHQLLVPESSAHRKRGVRCPDLRLPSYLIVGGLVFTQLCEPYLRAEYGEDFDTKAPIKLLEKWQYGVRQTPTAQVVVLSQVLAHTCNIGYEHLCNQIVVKVNGEPLTNLTDLVRLVEVGKTQTFLTFELEPHSELVVLETEGLEAATTELLANHQIPHDRSANLRDDAPAGRQPNEAAEGSAASTLATGSRQERTKRKR